MKISELIKNIKGCELKGDANTDVCDLACNASQIKRGMCFVALRGSKVDGHKFINDAVSGGASVIVSELPVDLPKNVAGVVVPNSREAFAIMSANFFGDPTKFMKLVGVTGTNGKTTITYLLETVFKFAGNNPGVIGTVAYRFGNVKESAPHTTPESYDLQNLFFRMRENNIDVCAMEVSSHALAQNRVTGCHFDAAIFTNLTPEHLDYHNGMESYFAAKAVLFEKLLDDTEKQNAFAVINVDDPYGKDLAKLCPVPVIFYGLSNDAHVRGENLSSNAHGISFDVATPKGSFALKSKLCGKFNVFNILAAVAVAVQMGIETKIIMKAIESASVVPGRFEAVENKLGVLALVDYAHTPDALLNVLANARELLTGNGCRVIAVFGCGGDRDRLKRPLMGKVAGKLADALIITSDNPRTENPDAIISEILPGVKEESRPFSNGRGYEVITDRRKAICRAVKIANKGDVIVVAGKGHEDYQIIGTKKIHFDDREVLREVLNSI